jgi:prefoldin subunit 5
MRKVVKKEEPMCDICCEKYNKSNRKPIECLFCGKLSCINCTKMYISTTIKDPHCMHCKVGWNTAFIRSVFPSSWLNKDYKEIREKILFDMETAKIPETQKFCDAWVHRDVLKKQKDSLLESLKQTKGLMESLSKRYEECKQDIWLLSEKDEELEKLKEEAHELHLNIGSVDEKMESINEEFEKCNMMIKRYTNEIEGNDVEKEADSFNLACPKEGCKGFINKQWKCPLCKSRICSDCHEIKGVMKKRRHL